MHNRPDLFARGVEWPFTKNPPQKNGSNDPALSCPSVYLSLFRFVGLFTGLPTVNHQSLSLSLSHKHTHTHICALAPTDQYLTPGADTGLDGEDGDEADSS